MVNCSPLVQAGVVFKDTQYAFRNTHRNKIASDQQETRFPSAWTAEKLMRYARLFADENGESHFDEVEMAFAFADYVQEAAPLELSPTFSANELGFMRAPAGWTSDFHVATARALFVVLSGEWEVTASDGESRRFANGSVLVVEDTGGKGHSSCVTSSSESVAVMVRLH